MTLSNSNNHPKNSKIDEIQAVTKVSKLLVQGALYPVTNKLSDIKKRKHN